MADTKFTLKKLPSGPEIALTGEISVGRSEESALRIVEGSPSRKHALISVADDGVSVQDLGSTNGTFVNDKRIDAKVKLNNNDRVRFDVEEFLFHIEEPPAPKGDLTVRRAVPPRDVVAESGRVKVPAGWVDNAAGQGGAKTQFMTPEQMEAERRRMQSSATASDSLGNIDTPLLIVPGNPDGAMRVQLRAASTDKKEWTVGSEGEREILIKRVGVSALHAKIVSDGKRWKVVDQLSANGTFVNGKRCNVSYLTSGDRISFGTVECVFQLPTSGASTVFKESGGRSGLSKVLLIAGVSFAITLVLLYFVLRRLGWV
jgi:pSer/pThr/pTyr-binding forkhead associated (FHA) protein